MYIAGLGTDIVTQANLTNNIFEANAARNQSYPGVVFGGGGALYLDGGVTLLNGSTFRQNGASGYGGALVYQHVCFPSGRYRMQVAPSRHSNQAIAPTSSVFLLFANTCGGACFVLHSYIQTQSCTESWRVMGTCQTWDRSVYKLVGHIVRL